MKSAVFALFLLAAFAPAQANPIEKIIQMIADLQTKVIGEGSDAQKAYDEYAGVFIKDSRLPITLEVLTGA